jgi:hypothetical protein
MDRSAQTALPSSYSKTFPAFGAGAAFTHAAGLGGKRFIDFTLAVLKAGVSRKDLG